MRCLRICTFLALLLGLTVAFGQAAQPILPKKKVTPPKTASTAKNPQTAQKKANPANFNVPATPLAGNVNPAGVAAAPKGNGLVDVKTADKEVAFDIATEAACQRLQATDGGLNFVAAKLEDVAEGQKVTLSIAGDKKENISGTVVKFDGKQVTIKINLPVGQDPPSSDGKQVALVSIRSL